MAGEVRTQTNDLIDTLVKQPEDFDFFQALRLLQRYWSDSPRIGYATHPSDEPLRLHQNPTLAFTGSLIHSFQAADEETPASIALNYHGLLGPNGALPINYTEHTLDRIRFRKDHSFIKFIDLFHHRMMSMLFRSWADANIAVAFDRSVQTGRLELEKMADSDGENHFFEYIGSLVGVGLAGLRMRDNLPEHVRMYNAPWLTRQVRSAEGLEKMISDFFEVPTEVESFQGRWLPIPSDSWAILGESPETGTLGENCFLGEIVWDCTASFRLKVGPVNHGALQNILPSTESFERMRSLIRTYIGHEFYWDIEVIVKASDVPIIELGQGGRLGLDAWLGDTDDQGAFHNIIFNPEYY